jgi:dTDP-4-amino-4,6-dideoxygalactose transaminase
MALDASNVRAADRLKNEAVPALHPNEEAPPMNDVRPVSSPTAPAFPEGLPLVRPRVRDAESVAKVMQEIVESGVLTNGPYVRRFEQEAADYLDVRHCIAVSSCTAGLMLVLRAANLKGDVVVPSFTFAATAHAISWNGLHPMFADIDPETLTLSATAVERAAGIRTSAILATHIYGTPCDVEALTAVADRAGLQLFFDAAHAFGSRHGDRPVGGFGAAEVFSLSPTKVLFAAEGGIIATNDDALAERCRIGRDYGHPGDYNCRFVGLNARMSEPHAAVALASLEDLDERIDERNDTVRKLRAALGELPGIEFPLVPAGDRSTFKDFTILVDPEAFGMSADELGAALGAEGVETKRYYAPPVHRMTAYEGFIASNGSLQATDRASSRALTLPLWSGMTDDHVTRLTEAVARIHRGG